jgi:hypothetical protein
MLSGTFRRTYHRGNKYGGTCTVCGHFVPAGRGTLNKVAGKWTVVCWSQICIPADEDASAPVTVLTKITGESVTLS